VVASIFRLHLHTLVSRGGAGAPCAHSVLGASFEAPRGALGAAPK
jgi:hypothetical protein